MMQWNQLRNLLLVGLSLILMACVQTTSPEDANIEMILEMSPQPPIVGKSELAITLTKTNGEPITDATLEIVGDMNHAGMVPVVRDLEAAGDDGIYRTPFEWTMGGDWFVTVVAFLADGTEVEQTFDMTVAMGEGGEMDHSDDAESDEMSHDHDEGHGEEGHGEDTSHAHDNDSHAENKSDDDTGHDHDAHDHDDAEEGDSSSNMDHSGEMDTAAMAGMIDTSAMHEIDEAARAGNMEPEYLATLEEFVETLNSLALPAEYDEDIEAANNTLADLTTAMEAEDMEALQPLVAEIHDIAHDLKIRLGKTDSEEHSGDHNEADDGHSHSHD